VKAHTAACGRSRTCLVFIAVSRVLTISEPSSSTPTRIGDIWVEPSPRVVASTAR
jgi:hypothetical protein